MLPTVTVPSNSDNLISPLLSISSDGTPDESLTANRVPVKSLLIENNWPALPS